MWVLSGKRLGPPRVIVSRPVISAHCHFLPSVTIIVSIILGCWSQRVITILAPGVSVWLSIILLLFFRVASSMWYSNHVPV